MSLRLSLVLVIAACWIGIGASIAINQLGQTERTEQPPFFFTLSPDDLRNISISGGPHSTSWHYREDDRRWYFDDEKDVPTSLYRWGGITQLLGGPRSQRELKKSIDDPALYGLDSPLLTGERHAARRAATHRSDGRSDPRWRCTLREAERI